MNKRPDGRRLPLVGCYPVLGSSYIYGNKMKKRGNFTLFLVFVFYIFSLMKLNPQPATHNLYNISPLLITPQKIENIIPTIL
jgi:hypothetical protein